MTPLTLPYHGADFDKTRYSTPNSIQMLELCDQDPAIDGHTHLLKTTIIKFKYMMGVGAALAVPSPTPFVQLPVRARVWEICKRLH